MKTDAVEQLKADEAVEDAFLLTKPYRLVARESRPGRSVIDVDGVRFGGNEIVLIAGPCTVESERQVHGIAAAVASAGATVLRGGAFKPSTSPYSFHGHGDMALEWLRDAAQACGLRVVTEVMDVRKVDTVAAYADILQIGTRNMQNYDLLREVGRSTKPVLLKRGMSAKIEEWLLAAEYVAAAGNPNIILCERGIRTFETATRNTLDLAAVPVVKGLSHLPVVVDPSHGTGKRDLVGPMSRAAVACGADGLLLEVHDKPGASAKDGSQSLTAEGFAHLVPELEAIARAIGRGIAARTEAAPV